MNNKNKELRRGNMLLTDYLKLLKRQAEDYLQRRPTMSQEEFTTQYQSHRTQENMQPKQILEQEEVKREI